MFRACVLLILMLSLAHAVAEQPRRLALLIGNQSYEPDNMRLAKPWQDVEVLGAALRAVGWEEGAVTVLRDADLMTMSRAVQQFAADLDAAGPDAYGFFYFSGHGGSFAQGNRLENYLLPTGAPIAYAEDLPVAGYRISDLTALLETSSAKGAFLVFDACRNALPSTGARGGGMKGLGRIEAAANLFVAYATPDGAFAPDDGAYALALAEEITRPGQDALRAFSRASARVREARNLAMAPVLIVSSLGDICFLSCDPAVPAPSRIEVTITQPESARPAPAPAPSPCERGGDAAACVREIASSKDYDRLDFFRELSLPELNRALDVALEIGDDRILAALAQLKIETFDVISLEIGAVSATNPRFTIAELSALVLVIERSQQGSSVTLRDASLPSNALQTSGAGSFTARSLSGTLTVNGLNGGYFPNCSLRATRLTGSLTYEGKLSCPKPAMGADIRFDLRDQ